MPYQKKYISALEMVNLKMVIRIRSTESHFRHCIRDTEIRDTEIRDTEIRDTEIRDTEIRDTIIRYTVIRYTVIRDTEGNRDELWNCLRRWKLQRRRNQWQTRSSSGMYT
ncbi:hypothetical protein [Methanosarcina vacuolata]|uniref:hypothetical protein n=1 Tax=Methanosarcina vacuolata TaxID=2215 RepID=UPI0018DD5E49|nr:hypothetical protein [Methanosarcina vacuolata]